ncbi:MAG: HD-GYP domain-containing protein [Acutalibacteraceae bacterium]
MNKLRINLYDLLSCISKAEELISTILVNHHQQVAYLSLRLAEQIGLSAELQYDIYIAALIHDIGATTVKERLELVESEPINVNSHAFRGAKLIEGFKPLQNAAKIIKFHHIPWDYGNGSRYMGEEVPLASQIIHLADRVCASIRPNHNIITQLPSVLSRIRMQSGSVFNPDLVDTLFEISDKEYIWLDLIFPNPAQMVSFNGILNILTLEIDDIVDLALIFSRIIDFRSRFTASHSAGVAKVAERLAELCGFSPNECKMMLIAGYLHDLGKIAISDEILEKPIKLSEQEFNEMRAHTYYTFRMLEPLEQLKTISIWAAYHHEKLDGTGYPFHLLGKDLPLGSRIMAVADVFTAITEDRPYRKGMDFQSTEKVLTDMVKNNALDGMVANKLIENFSEINHIREVSQCEAVQMYESFLKT